jgi:hypothetical protein
MYSRGMLFLSALLAALLPFGAMYVTSLPAGADVWVDGSYIGRTPVLVDGLRSGKHAITITKSGWKVAEVDQDIAGGNTVATNVMLSPLAPPPARGELELHGLEAGAKVSFDHQAWRPLEPRYELPIGQHHLSIREGQGKFERDVTLYPDQTTHVVFRPPAQETHSAVVAALASYVPAAAAKVTGERIVVKWGGHTVVGRLGDAKFLVDGRDVVYDAPAGMVSGRLYLPLELIMTITGAKTK